MCNDFIQTAYELEIIQGDSFELYLSINDVNYADIDNIYFTSSELKINKKFELVDSDFILILSSEETLALSPIISTDYDITVYFNDSTVKTVQYRGRIKVYEKTNKVTL